MLSNARSTSGMINYATIRHQACAIDESLEEMKSRDVIRLIENQQIMEGK